MKNLCLQICLLGAFLCLPMLVFADNSMAFKECVEAMGPFKTSFFAGGRRGNLSSSSGGGIQDSDFSEFAYQHTAKYQFEVIDINGKVTIDSSDLTFFTKLFTNTSVSPNTRSHSLGIPDCNDGVFDPESEGCLCNNENDSPNPFVFPEPKLYTSKKQINCDESIELMNNKIVQVVLGVQGNEMFIETITIDTLSKDGCKSTILKSTEATIIIERLSFDKLPEVDDKCGAGIGGDEILDSDLLEISLENSPVSFMLYKLVDTIEIIDNTPPSSPCEMVMISTDENTLIVDKLTAPNKNVLVYKIDEFGGWDLVDRCKNVDCSERQVFDGLMPGNYFVQLQLFDENWQLICDELRENIKVEGAEGMNPDPDPMPTGDCSDIQYITNDNQLIIQQLNAPIVDLKVFDGDWQQVYTCGNGECPNSVQLDNLSGGTYNVIVKFYDLNQYQGWEFLCRTTDQVQVPRAAQNRDSPLPHFSLYPNPAQEVVFVDLRGFKDKAVDISIYNVLGKEVFQQQIDKVLNPQQQIALTDFTNGIHFMNIKAEGKPSVVQPFIVARMY